MVICFRCSSDTKRQIDALLAEGAYADLSELIAIAIANQSLLQEDRQYADRRTPKGDDPSSPSVDGQSSFAARAAAGESDPSNRRVNGVSALFSKPATTDATPVADSPLDEPGDLAEPIKPSLWMFGQYNRLLPAKASVRALANLLASGRGIEPIGAAKKIAGEATELGNQLRILDRRHERSRDEMLSTAFPGVVDPDKGRLRYASQFVASVDRSGKLSGLLAELKFINYVSSQDGRISLTQAGWDFARLENPVLDGLDGENAPEKFSLHEREFLLGHIASSVPRERSAYATVLSAISRGQDSPDAISVILRKLEGKKATDSLIATQRSGVVSRMSELGLLGRDRDGIRVRYRLSEFGEQFLSNQKRIA